MADRVLFRWPGAAIMGDDRPRYPRMDEGFVGSPVWGKGGVIAALLARVAEVEARVAEAERQTDKATWLLRQLADRLDFIHEDPAYRSVWAINQIHVGPYQGPTYEAELAAARAFLAGAPAAPPVESPADEPIRSATPAFPHLLLGEPPPDWMSLQERARRAPEEAAAPPPPSLPPEVQRVLEAASRWVDAAAAPAPEFEPCDACIIYGPDIDNPAKHPQEECPVTEGARLAWSERRVATSTELHASVAALRARKEEQGG